MVGAPSISVIVPAYRASGTIGRALDSIVGQTHRPDEIIVVDDGSPDDIGAAVERWRSGDNATRGVPVQLRRKTNGGAASARNHGIDHSTGELIAFLDADDFWMPTKLERQLAVLNQHPEVALLASDFWTDEPRRGLHQQVFVIPPEFRDKVLRMNGADILRVVRCISTPTVMLRRSVLGEDRFDASLRTAEDIDLWIRLVPKAPIYLLSDPLTTVMILETSLTHSDADHDFPNMLTVIQRHANLLKPDELRAEEARVYRNWAAGHLGAGNARKALWPAWQRFRREPWSLQAWWIVLKAAVWSCTPWGARRRA